MNRGPMKPGEKREVTKAENQFNLAIMILRNELQRRSDVMKDRLAATEGGLRNLGLLKWLVDFIQDAITRTLTDKDVQKYVTYAEHGRLTIDIPGAVETRTHVAIDKKDLNELANYAVYGQCTTCIREGKEIKRCPLRQILLHVAPPDELKDHKGIMSCEYIQIGQMIMQAQGDDGHEDRTD